jgi:hypothetical protein
MPGPDTIVQCGSGAPKANWAPVASTPVLKSVIDAAWDMVAPTVTTAMSVWIAAFICGGFRFFVLAWLRCDAELSLYIYKSKPKLILGGKH